MTLYSHSRLSCFEQCPLKFKLKYIEKVKTDVETGIEAFLGIRVHETMEKLYTDLKFQKIPTLKELIAYFNDLWNKNWNNRIVIIKDYGQENYRKMGEKFITDYYKRYHPFNQSRVISMESRILLNLDKVGNYKLQGYIDRINYAGKGVYEIHDYKTNANLPIQFYIDQDRQLALYAIAVKKNYKDCKKVNLIWHFMAFDKKLTSSRTTKQLNTLKKETITLIKKIEKEEKFKPKTGTLCNWCEFKPICSEWAHLYKITKLTPKKFKEEEGVKLVNQLTKLGIEKKELELKIQLLMGEIMNYAEQLGVSVVFGADAKASIKEYESMKIPKKNSKERLLLEKLIKKYNKWSEVSALNAAMVKKIIKERSWPEKLLVQTEKLFIKETGKRVSVSRLKKE